mmetsp:Transcript_30455/g.69734  ORF Transcript_30455/g.69734 Transcript_30455/m.69734 type:complete len:274 (+) Transcript_30455:626-1447(+)
MADNVLVLLEEFPDFWAFFPALVDDGFAFFTFFSRPGMEGNPSRASLASSTSSPDGVFTILGGFGALVSKGKLSRSSSWYCSSVIGESFPSSRSLHATRCSFTHFPSDMLIGNLKGTLQSPKCSLYAMSSDSFAFHTVRSINAFFLGLHGGGSNSKPAFSNFMRRRSLMSVGLWSNFPARHFRKLVRCKYSHPRSSRSGQSSGILLSCVTWSLGALSPGCRFCHRRRSSYITSHVWKQKPISWRAARCSSLIAVFFRPFGNSECPFPSIEQRD